MKKLLVGVLALFVLSGCFTSEDELAEKRQECEQTNTCDGPNTEVPIVQVTGTAATGLAIINATVTATDADGNNLAPAVRSNARGEYTLSFEQQVAAPIIITVAPPGGKVLQAILDDAEATVVNVNPITNFVADQLLAEKSLATVTAGEVASFGQARLDELFGPGLQYQAFSTESFTAKQSVVDLSDSVSVADVVLDSLLELAAEQDIDVFLSQQAEQGTGLFLSNDFVFALAKNLAKVNGSVTDVNSIIDSAATSEQVAQQLAILDTVQATVEEMVTEVSQLPGMNALVLNLSVDALVTVMKPAVISEQGVDSANLTVAKDNVVDTLLDDVLQFIASDAHQELTIDELTVKVDEVAAEIVVIVEQQAIDLTQEEIDATALEAAVQVKVSVDTGSNWDQTDWDTLTWK